MTSIEHGHPTFEYFPQGQKVILISDFSLTYALCYNAFLMRFLPWNHPQNLGGEKELNTNIYDSPNIILPTNFQLMCLLPL